MSKVLLLWQVGLIANVKLHFLNLSNPKEIWTQIQNTICPPESKHNLGVLSNTYP